MVFGSGMEHKALGCNYDNMSLELYSTGYLNYTSISFTVFYIEV
jgi:hypothetical protein